LIKLAIHSLHEKKQIVLNIVKKYKRGVCTKRILEILENKDNALYNQLVIWQALGVLVKEGKVKLVRFVAVRVWKVI
jgi:hypothetical protein